MTASPIRDSAGKLCITPGKWEVANRAAVGNRDGEHVANCLWANEAYCNAALIAEAGTVTNATNRTPAELLKERDEWEVEATRLHGENERLAALVRELRGALEAYRKHDPFFMDDNLLTKSEGV